MLQITIKKSESRNFSKACKMAIALGGSIDQGDIIINILKVDIYSKHNDIMRFLMFAHALLTVEIYWQGEKIGPFDLVLNIRKVGDCLILNSSESCESRCKHLVVPPRITKLTDMCDWDQENLDLKQSLIKQAEEKGLFLCPYFNGNTIDRIISIDKRRIN